MSKLLTLTGPSCSGKTTLINELVANHGYKALVSHTTRPPRKGEVDGKDYFFVSKDQFDNMKKENKLMENVEFNSYLYGLSVDQMISAFGEGLKPVVIVEPKGLKQISEYALNHSIKLCRVFIDGDIETLIQRYLMRASDEDFSEGETALRHAKRLKSLYTETKEWPFISGLYDHYISGYNKSTEQGYIKFIKERA